jgi:hypothetical protein
MLPGNADGPGIPAGRKFDVSLVHICTFQTVGETHLKARLDRWIQLHLQVPLALYFLLGVNRSLVEWLLYGPGTTYLKVRLVQSFR